jgi:alpha-1,2-mannosyltransferase
VPHSARSKASDRRLWVIAIAVAVGFAAVLAVLLAPWGAKMIDLDVYRAAARAVIGGSDPYSVSGPDRLPFTYPIFATLVFVPFALVPTVVARTVITLVSFAALVLICHLSLGQVLSRSGRRLAALSLPVALIAVSSHPVLDTLLFGQVNLILVAMVLADILLIKGRGRGVLVGLAAGIKLTPGLFLVYYLVTRQWRAALNAAVTAALTVLAGFAIRPEAAWDFWTRYALDPARTGNVTYAGNQSILAITARLMREAHPPSALTWGLTAVVAATALVVAAGLHRYGRELAAVSVVAAAALLASPISWTHHWVWFIPAVTVVAAWVYRAGGGWRWWPLGLAVAVLWSGPMRFMPLNDLRELAQTRPQQLVTNSFGLLAVVFLAWAAYVLRREVLGARRGQRDGAGVVGSEHVDHEPQWAGRLTVGWVGVGQALRDVQLYPGADLDADQSLVPALDDSAPTDLERGRVVGSVLPGGVEHFAGVVVGADVVDGDRLAGLDRGAVALDEGGHLERGQGAGTGADHRLGGQWPVGPAAGAGGGAA